MANRGLEAAPTNHHGNPALIAVQLPQPSLLANMPAVTPALFACHHIDKLSFCGYSLRMVTWDESKRKSNLRSHAIDLASIEAVFDTPLITKEDTRLPYGEQRLQSLGLLDGEVVFLVWTERESGAHVISCRKAEKYEQKFYFANIEIG